MVQKFLVPAMKDVNYPWNGLLAQAAEAKSSKINATLGVFLDDELNIGILPSVSKTVSLDRKKVTEYAPSHGVLALREAWKSRLVHNGHINADDSEKASLPVVTAGLTDGLSIAGRMFLQAHQSELVIAKPNWPNYELIFENIQNAKLREFDLFEESPKAKTLTPSVKNLLDALQKSHESVAAHLPLVLLMNVPHNPTGYSYTEEEGDKITLALREFLETHPERHLVVIIDDAYMGFNYDPLIRKTSFLRGLCDLHERLLAAQLSGATKEIYAWGLRVGFITFSSKGKDRSELKILEDKAAALIRGTLSNVSMLSQHLTLNALFDQSTDETHALYFGMLQRRYRSCQHELANPEFKEIYSALPFNSGYFFALRIIDARVNSETLRKVLIEKHSVGIVTITHNLIRVAYSAISEKQIPDLFKALVRAAQTLIAQAS